MKSNFSLLPVIIKTCLIASISILQSCSKPKHPNTIVIMVDDLGQGDIDHRKDNYLLPNIDMLRKEGMVFKNTYSDSPSCSPTRATLISGQHAARLKLVRHIPVENPDGRTDNEFHITKTDPVKFPSRNWLPLDVVTYAEALKDLGYQTGFVGKWHLGHEPYYPIHQGFDKQYGVSNFGHTPDYYPPYFGGKDDSFNEIKEGKYLTDQITDYAIKYLEECSPDQPFHLTVFYYSAHAPYIGRSDLVDKLSGQIKGKNNLQHAAMMLAVDESVGRIRSYLRENNLEKNTAIVFLGDQGSHFDNSPLRGGKAGGVALYEGGARIPMSITWPGVIPAGENTELVATTIDLFPTLLNMGGGKSKNYPYLDGESLLSVARDNSIIERKDVFMYRSYEDQYAAIRSGDWKMIAYRSGKKELYNLEDDLSETNNIYREKPLKTEELSAKLNKWEKKVGVYRKPEPPPMGWNSWNYFGKQDINEEIVKDIIDAFVDNGLKEAGYKYIVIDGGWRDTLLGPNKELLPHPVKFPNGIKPLADYAHSKGLKLGLHTVPGDRDCGSDKVGAFGHEEVHFKQLTDWGIDFIKLDKCLLDGGWNEYLLKETYFKWHDLIKKSGREIIFSISAYEYRDWYPEIADIARTTYDISCKKYRGANFDSTKQGIMPIAEMNNQWADKARNGYWNDPDILVIGDQGLTEVEQEVHFALWCIMSAPLMLGNDPRNMLPLEKELALNLESIAVNQDPTEQGRLIDRDDDKELWGKTLEDGSMALLIINRNDKNNITIETGAINTGFSDKAIVRDIFARKNIGMLGDNINKILKPHEGWFILLK